MRHLTGGLFYIIGGALVGAVSALAVIENAGFEKLGGDGPWLSRAAGLQGPARLYIEASYLMRGRFPPSGGQLSEAIASTDSDGGTLSASCSYVIASSGALPPWWSIAVTTAGEPLESLQTVLDTTTTIREADGSVRIIAAAQPQPGNWIKVPPGRFFSVLYTASITSDRNAAKAPPFAIAREGC